MEERKTMRGGWGAALRSGMKASVVSAAPKVFTAKVSWKTWRRAEGVRLVSGRETPALLIRMSRWPNLERTSSAAAAMESSDVTLGRGRISIAELENFIDGLVVGFCGVDWGNFLGDF